MRFLRSITAAFTAAAATAGLLVPTATAAPAVTWEKCPKTVGVASATCGRVEVPMYYDRPDSPTISVGFVLRPATGHKLGTVMVNPGGPGGDAYTYVAGGTDFSDVFSWDRRITDSFDLLAVQPRGLPGSTPLHCVGHGVPATPPSADPLTLIYSPGAAAKSLCEATDPGYTDSITSENTVNDFDQVRQALGIDQLNLIGLSYGTYLMSRYATKFPEHTNKLVLDSLMAPSLAWNGTLAVQKPGYTARFYEMLQWIADRDDTYHLGKTPYQVYKKWADAVVRESGAPPAMAPPPLLPADNGGQPADLINLTNPMVTALRAGFGKITSPAMISELEIAARVVAPDARRWPEFARAVSGEAPIPSEDQVFDKLRGTFSEEEIHELIEQQANAQLMQLVLLCNENSAPANPLLVPQSFVSQLLLQDVFATPSDLAASGRMCGPVRPVDHVRELSAAGLKFKPLAVQSVGDPQTPEAYSHELARTMDATVVRVADGNHGHIAMGNPVVDGIVATYLRTGKVTATTAPGVVIVE